MMTEPKPKAGRRRPGRPPAAFTLKRAIEKLGIDPDKIDPARVLAAIAANPEAPATARVAACKALLDSRPPPPPPPPAEDKGYKIEWLAGIDFDE